MRCWRPLALAVALLAVSACGREGPPPGPEFNADGGTVLRRGNGSEPNSLDPHKGNGVPANNILRDLYEGLVATNADGTMMPGAAADWTVSKDRKTYVFNLREEARWSNGDPVTAADFVAGFHRALAPESQGGFAQMLAPIENASMVINGTLPPEELGVEALDERRLEIRLEGRTPYFLEVLAHPVSYPVHRPTLEEHGGKFTRPEVHVTNGAYQLVEWVAQSHIRLSRNPEYHDGENVQIAEVWYYPIENQAAELKRYRAGELDWTFSVPSQQFGWIQRHLPDQLVVSPQLAIGYLGLNVASGPLAGQPGLRRALAMVLDRDLIVGAVTGAGEIPAFSWVPPMEGYAQQLPAWAAWSRDRRRREARSLYQAAGYSRREPLEIELLYNTGENNKRLAVAVAAMWKQDLGVHTVLRNEEFRVYLATLRDGEKQTFRSAWVGDYRDAFSFAEILGSHHGMNYPGYQSDPYDRLLQRSMLARTPERRRALLEEAERIMLDDQPVIPLYFYVTKRLIKPWVTGWTPNVMDIHPTRHLRIEQP